MRSGRGDRVDSRDGGSSGLHWYSQKEYSGEDYSSISKGVRGDSRDGCFSGSCEIDGNQWSDYDCNSHVGWYGHDGR